MGVDVFRYKLLSFAVSSFYIGVPGSLLAYQAGSISPEIFPGGRHRLPGHGDHRGLERCSAPSSGRLPHSAA